MTTTSTLYTVGYERRTVSTLVRDLLCAGVKTLVDVRELPLSRRKGFSKTKLSAALADAGIEYRHARSLGNPKRYRQMYREGNVARGSAGYRRHLHNGSYPALLELAEQLDDHVCLLCVEHEHERCHRSVIVEALTAGASRPERRAPLEQGRGLPLRPHEAEHEERTGVRKHAPDDEPCVPIRRAHLVEELRTDIREQLIAPMPSA